MRGRKTEIKVEPVNFFPLKRKPSTHFPVSDFMYAKTIYTQVHYRWDEGKGDRNLL